jgi:hypothetical protein
MLREFVHSHEKQMTSYAHDMTTTSDLLRQMMEEMLPDDQCGNLIPALQRNLQVFFRQVRFGVSVSTARGMRWRTIRTKLADKANRSPSAYAELKDETSTKQVHARSKCAKQWIRFPFET